MIIICNAQRIHLAHNKVHGSNISQAVILLLCTKDNIFQRFMVEGERLINYQNQVFRKS